MKISIFPGLDHVEWTHVDMASGNRDGLDMHRAADQSKLAPDFTYGGYLEDRTLLWNGFEPDMKRMIHLGVDLSLPAGRVVASPRDSVVIHILRDTTTFNGWGGRIILKMSDHPFPFVLLGHLHPDRIRVAMGDTVREGQVVGELGDEAVNGGWFPHLHIQQMSRLWKNLDGYSDAPEVFEWVCNPIPLITVKPPCPS